MGAKVSLHDDDEDIQKYGGEQTDDLGMDEPLTGSEQKSYWKVWFDMIWQWLLKDIRALIIYITILGCFIGLGIPFILYLVDKPNGSSTIYGSCLINQNFRFKCLINQLMDPTEDECINALCCWENNNTLPFKCFHSFNSAYSYNVNSTSDNNNGIYKSSEILLNSNLKDNRVSNLKIILKWINLQQLNIQMYDPIKFPNGIEEENENILSSLPSSSRVGDISIDGLNVTFSNTKDDYFYIKIVRIETNETIFDTRIGPLISDENSISFTTILPTQYFYGLRGGQGNGPIMYDVINGYNSMDFPFYMPLEKNGNVHGVLFNTTSPFIVQFIEAPGFMFHFEGNKIAINMNFFIGPTAKDVFNQINTYHTNKQNQFRMPPYWALGLHLCRQISNGEDTLKQIDELGKWNEFQEIPYDSDCIDWNLRIPFEIDGNKYNETYLDSITELIIKNNSKHIFLTQKIGLPKDIYENKMDNINNLIQLTNSNNPLIGHNNGKDVYYPNFYYENSDWLLDEFMDANISIPRIGGLTLIDNFPFNDNSNKICSSGIKSQPSRLQQMFLNEKEKLICPDAIHKETDTISKKHFDIHNEYGHEALKKFEHIFQEWKNETNESNERFIITSSSIRPNSYVYNSGFNGLIVPFTWNGMVDSLTYILRNFMFLPFAGTPICGNYVPSDASWNDDELCLRWFQLGLLLPFAKNTYGKLVGRGPRDFNMNDQKNLIDAIHERYRYNPYYYTLFHKYGQTGETEPVIRPLIYDFDKDTSTTTFNIFTQFMIGPAIMATPILSKAATTRDVYFPPGTWYEITGGLVYEDLTNGAFLRIPGLPSITPLFIRGGHVVPTLTNPDASTGEKSRDGLYTILATYPRDNTQDKSEGNLFVDNGWTMDSISHEVNFTVTKKSITIISNCTLNDPSIYNTKTIINQIKIFGFPPPEPEVDTNIPGQIRPEIIYSEEDQILRIKTFSFNWCDYNNVTFTWIQDGSG